jgi:hypothetical protein
MPYSITRDLFLLLETAFTHDLEKAEVFVKAIESSIQAIGNQTDEKIGVRSCNHAFYKEANPNPPDPRCLLGLHVFRV